MQEVENEQWCSLVLMYWYKLADFDKLSLWNVFMLYNFPGFFFFSNFIYLFIYYFWLCWVFVSVQGLSLVAASGGYSSSQCAGFSLWRPLLLRSTGSRHAGSVVVTHGSSCDSRVQLLCGMWDLPRPGLEPVSPALAGRFSTTAPPGKPQASWAGIMLKCYIIQIFF